MRNRIIAAVCVLVLTLAMLALAQEKKKDSKPEKARDPVCNLIVDKNPELSANHKGQTYYFCSRTDREEFKKNPQKYVK